MMLHLNMHSSSFLMMMLWHKYIHTQSILIIASFMVTFFLCLVLTYSPFDNTRKDVFCLAFYFKLKYFVLIDHILSETILSFLFLCFVLKYLP